MHISIIVPEQGVIEAISPPYRLFKSANDFLAMQGHSPFFEVEFVGHNSSVDAQDGEYNVKIHQTIDKVAHTDLIIIPALYGDIQTAVRRNHSYLEWVITMHHKGAEVASLCTGAFLLAATGLADGKECSTHWAYYDLFRSMYPEVQVIDGRIISDSKGIYSSGGANSLWNLLLYLLEKYTSRDLAITAAKFFAIDFDRFDQGMFTIFNGQKNHSDEEILKAQEIIESEFHKKLSVDELASYIAVNRRTFERRFKNATNNTVVQYIQRVRVEAAKRQLEASRKNISEVMYDVGYNDTKAFREVFKKYAGITPIDYRNKYASTG